MTRSHTRRSPQPSRYRRPTGGYLLRTCRECSTRPPEPGTSLCASCRRADDTAREAATQKMEAAATVPWFAHIVTDMLSQPDSHDPDPPHRCHACHRVDPDGFRIVMPVTITDTGWQVHRDTTHSPDAHLFIVLCRDHAQRLDAMVEKVLHP